MSTLIVEIRPSVSNISRFHLALGTERRKKLAAWGGGSRSGEEAGDDLRKTKQRPPQA
jgi:hypothetical protein